MKAQNPVSWYYSAKKLSDNSYELHLTARLATGWHVYAQKQPENFIGTATSIRFNKNPLLQFTGKVEEQGKLQVSKEPVLETEAMHYSNEVDFVQKVVVRGISGNSGGLITGGVKTVVSGTILFQVCTDSKCLPPTETTFNIALD